MAMNDVFDKHFLATYEIMECYDLLASLLFSKEYNRYIDEINIILSRLKRLIKTEFNKYNTLNLEDIRYYTNELRKIPGNWHDLVDFRICYRLACVFDRKREYTVNINELFPGFDYDYELGIRDVINSKIEIDTYKLISRKLGSLNCSDNKSREYIDKLISLNNQYVVLKLCMRELEEILLLKASFDIDKIDDIDLSIIEDKLSIDLGKDIKIRDIIKDKVYKDVITLINRLRVMNLETDSVSNIYDNFFLTAHLEILLCYLDIDKLNAVSLYCSKISTKNIMVKNDVNLIIRMKIDNYR